MTRPGISIQLYTVRNALEQDLEGTLSRLHRLGFTHVEPFLFTQGTQRLASALRRLGMHAPTGHEQVLGDDQEKIFSAATELGITTVIDNFRQHDIWDDAVKIGHAAEQLNRAAEKAADYGVRVGYHNHHWEFAPVGDKTGLEVFADELAPGVVLELDTYWAAAGGMDVPLLIERLGERVVLLHLKDGEIRQDFEGQSAVGSGRMPIADILEAAVHLEYGVIELDTFDGDIFEAVEDSHRYLADIGLGR